MHPLTAAATPPRRPSTHLPTAPLTDAAPEPLEPLDPREPLDARRVTGISARDEARIARVATAARAASTRKLYDWAWFGWERWCADRQLEPLPADPAALCVYLIELVDTGMAVISLGPIGSAIGHVHRLHSLPNPIDHPTVRQVRSGLRRTHGTAPRRQARPLTVPDIRRIVTTIDRRTTIGARDAAIVLLGYASALRCGELAALTLADLTFKPTGLLLHLDRSKTDQDGEGQVVGVAHGTHPDTDPVTALRRWLQRRGTTPGPLFVSLRGGAVSDRALGAPTISRIVHARAEEAGLPATRITGHSLRAGHATTAYTAGVHLERIAAQTRHKDLAVLLNRYIRPLAALETTSSRDLGL